LGNDDFRKEWVCAIVEGLDLEGWRRREESPPHAGPTSRVFFFPDSQHHGSSTPLAFAVDEMGVLQSNPIFSFWRREGHIGTQEWIEEKKTANAKFLRQNTKISLRVDGLIGPKSALACHELSRVSIMRRVPCRTHCHNRCQVGRRRRRTGGV